MKLLTPILIFLSLALSASAQARPDLSLFGGGGVAGGEDLRTSGFPGVGATVGFPYSGRHRFQVDYLFTNINGELRAPEIGLNVPDADTRHQFLTGSYVLQARSGRSRPFFQAGAGLIHRRFHTAAAFYNGPSVVAQHRVETDTTLALLVGTGVTIDLNNSLFIRPQVRLYLHTGVTLTFMPALGFGYRF